jgi:putative membrane protein
MTRFLIRLGINAVALYAAFYVVENTIGGLTLQNENWLTYLWMAIIFGLVNALFSPLLKFLTCPLIILTLGLFVLIINTFLFYLTGWIGSFFGAGFSVENFWSAFVGSLVVSVVSVTLTLVFKDELKKK